MATLKRVVNKRSLHSLFLQNKIVRSFVSTSILKEKEKQGLFKTLWESADISAYTNAHSKTLTDDNTVTYELICKFNFKVFYFVLWVIHIYSTRNRN